MKFAHVRTSGHFTFAEQIFHREAISFARKGKFRCVPALRQVRVAELFCLSIDKNEVFNGGLIDVESLFVEVVIGGVIVEDIVVFPGDVLRVRDVDVAPTLAPCLGGGKGVGIEKLVVSHDHVLGGEEGKGGTCGAVYHVVFHKDVADGVAVGGIEVGGVLVNTCHHRKACGARLYKTFRLKGRKQIHQPTLCHIIRNLPR